MIRGARRAVCGYLLVSVCGAWLGTETGRAEVEPP